MSYGTLLVLSDTINKSLITGNSTFKTSTNVSKGKSILELVTNDNVNVVANDCQPPEMPRDNPFNYNIDYNNSQMNTLTTMTQESNTKMHRLPVPDKKTSTNTAEDKNAIGLLESAVGHIINSTDFQKLNNVFSRTFPTCVTNKSVDVNNDDPQGTPVVLNSICPGQSLLRSNTFTTNRPEGTFCLPNPRHLPAQTSLPSNSLFVSPNGAKSIFIYDHKNLAKDSLAIVVSKCQLPICSPKHVGMHRHKPGMPNLLVNNVAYSVHRKESSTRFHNTNSGSVKSNGHVQQANAVSNSGMEITEKSESKDNDQAVNRQCSDSSSFKTKPISILSPVPEEVTRDLELLKEYFVDNKCLICGFVSKRSRGGWFHMVVHMTVKPHQCKKCSKSFATEERLMQHNLCHSSKDNLLKFACSTCGKCFNRSSYLRSHEDRHANVIRHKCEICQKGFARMMNLRRHARTHTGEKPFVCEVCGNSFASSSSCKKHVNVHTKEVAYNCEVCNKKFYSAHYFHVHMKAHEQGNIFQCDVCDARFNFKSNLIQHKLTHSQNRSHKCDECGKTFKLPHHLRQHLDTHKFNPKSSKNYKRALKPRRIKCDFNDENMDAPNEDYIVPDVQNIDFFPEIQEGGLN